MRHVDVYCPFCQRDESVAPPLERNDMSAYLITVSRDNQTPNDDYEEDFLTLEEAKAYAATLVGDCRHGEGFVMISVPGQYYPWVDVAKATVYAGPLRWRAPQI